MAGSSHAPPGQFCAYGAAVVLASSGTRLEHQRSMSICQHQPPTQSDHSSLSQPSTSSCGNEVSPNLSEILDISVITYTTKPRG
eukprot:m.103241 g.103241  ORF g.103241 m.103241 type:complete len:84 (-) comp15217_c0_seq6:632-883(-)